MTAIDDSRQSEFFGSCSEAVGMTSDIHFASSVQKTDRHIRHVLGSRKMLPLKKISHYLRAADKVLQLNKGLPPDISNKLREVRDAWFSPVPGVFARLCKNNIPTLEFAVIGAFTIVERNSAPFVGISLTLGIIHLYRGVGVANNTARSIRINKEALFHLENAYEYGCIRKKLLSQSRTNRLRLQIMSATYNPWEKTITASSEQLAIVTSKINDRHILYLCRVVAGRARHDWVPLKNGAIFGVVAQCYHVAAWFYLQLETKFAPKDSSLIEQLMREPIVHHDREKLEAAIRDLRKTPGLADAAFAQLEAAAKIDVK